MIPAHQVLATRLAAQYDPDQYPSLLAQARLWSHTRPLAGRRILDATPVFTNTTAKYVALLVGGAQLTVSAAPGLPCDPDVVSLLVELGIPVVAGASDLAPDACPDVVLDCAGQHAGVPSRHGYVELTRTGAAAYQGRPAPVVLVDDSPVKQVETALGTGDGFVRAMAALGHPIPPGAEVVVVGGGKVGRGIAAAATAAGARVAVVDVAGTTVPPGCRTVNLAVPAQVSRALAGAWCVVTATGVPAALAAHAQELADGGALLANMGVEDEFGPAVPASRVLNAKAPVNFVLPEPTLLRYLDPVLALHNAAALTLLAGGLPAGLNRPEPEQESAVMAAARTGALGAELA